jgi:hypothetical protein
MHADAVKLEGSFVLFWLIYLVTLSCGVGAQLPDAWCCTP